MVMSEMGFLKCMRSDLGVGDTAAAVKAPSDNLEGSKDG